MEWALIVLMMIGAAPASTGGGLKTTTLAVLLRDSRKLLRGEGAGRSLGIALSWLGLYLGMALLGLLMLLFVEPQLAADQVVFLTISALSNVGLSREFNLVPGNKPTTLRFDVVNLFDTIYEIRDGSGIGVFAPQYGPRRGFYLGISQKL